MMRPGYRSKSKAKRPLLLLFPGCCDDATTSVMRIRKVQAQGLPGNAAAAASDERGDSTSSAAALADESHLLPASSAENSIPDDGPSSRSPALQKRDLPTPQPDRPYMNLDELVSSLARKKWFPDEEMYHKTGESSDSLINFFDDQSVDTSLCLAINPDPVRIKGGHIIDDGRLQYGSTTTSARVESPLEAGKSTEHPEVYGESYQTTSIPETGEEVEGEDDQQEQAMKSSTESMERRPRRTSRSTGRMREWSAEEGQEEEDEDESSEHSSQRTKTRKRKRKKSEHSSVTQDYTSSVKKVKTKKKPGGSSSRSGRPKKLKYMKQENREELGNQCNRSDGKGWTCPLLAKTGYQLCDHHLDKLRCKPGSRSKYNKSKKKNLQQEKALP